MPLRRILRALSVFTVLAPLSLVACSDDDDDEHEDDAHEPMAPSCVDLSDVCHEADTGSGPAHDCHEIAHSDVEADCAAALADCTTACMTSPWRGAKSQLSKKIAKPATVIAPLADVLSTAAWLSQ